LSKSVPWAAPLDILKVRRALAETNRLQDVTIYVQHNDAFSDIEARDDGFRE
jgi:hypothetical protein